MTQVSGSIPSLSILFCLSLSHHPPSLSLSLFCADTSIDKWNLVSRNTNLNRFWEMCCKGFDGLRPSWKTMVGDTASLYHCTLRWKRKGLEKK